jgi:nucleoside-diphosphate-sugar epimerase
MLINIAREKGVSAYIETGMNRWNGVHILDAASLYRQALEHAVSGVRFHAVGEEEIIFSTLAETIAKQLNIPLVSIPAEQAAAHFGWFTHFAELDIPASSQITQQRLNWQPNHQTLLADLKNGTYKNV